jgi:hypothetical protein
MAPSTIEGAGYGIYTTKDIGEGDFIGEPDVIIPVIDKFKTLPYRGQQQFLSWLGYVWPKEPDYFYNATQASFPKIPKAMYKVDPGLNAATSLKFRDEYKERVSAFAPGIASLVNSNPDLINIKSTKEGELISFSSKKEIKAGSELFLYYGDLWHKRFNKRQESEVEYDTLQDYHKDVLPTLDLPTEQDKRDKLAKKKRKKLDVDDDDEFDGSDEAAAAPPISEPLVTGIKGYISDLFERQKKVFQKMEKKDAQEMVLEKETEEDVVEQAADATRSVDWIKKNGMCIDNLRIGPSKKRGAARFTEKSGAFTKNFIPKGERIAPAPLLALKRDDLVMYEADETQPVYRDVLDLDEIVGEEELLNFCYGDPDSELLLLPYSPVVSYINHGGKKPNAEIRWPQDAPWLKLHPLEVLDMSGKLMMEIVALRDIQPDEEIVLDFGQEWDEEWREYHQTEEDDMLDEFRHELGVPKDFYPENWKHQSVKYELATSPLKPGELEQMRWKHNGKVVCKHCYRVGLPTGFSQHFRDFADERGITRLYEKLLSNDILGNNEWTVFDTHGEQWFAQQYMKRDWNFNMHYIAAWDEKARVSLLRAMGSGGFETALESIGTAYGLDNMTCFHTSFMGISEADDSFTHADVYASDEKGFNIIWPLKVVDGSNPELDIVSDDTNIVISVNYEYDVAYVMGDWVSFPML